MKVKVNQAYREFINAPRRAGWRGVRVKDIRQTPLYPGGRTRLSLFAATDDGERSHPRLRATMPPVADPEPPGILFAPAQAPRTAAALRTLIEDALHHHATILDAGDLNMALAPLGSPRYWKNSIRVQRTAAFFAQVRDRLAAWLTAGDMNRNQAHAARRVVHELEDAAYAVDMEFDVSNTGGGHNYGNDEPFVHYLEKMWDSLPREGTESFATLPAEGQYAVRRQRGQILNHLDYVMRHKYAYSGIDEADIERTLGGFLIDRETRLIVSEVPDPDSLVPRYELLRIDPGAAHPHAGAWVYRDRRGRVYLQDGTKISVANELLRASPRAAKDLTFRRAPKHRGLREGVRFDWDSSGWVQAGPIEWIKWAGHCDVHAVLEALGVTLEGKPSVTEYRSDTGVTIEYDRFLLLEMLVSVVELGSGYVRADGTGFIARGIHRFGGARNDSLPDRLQFRGPGPGRSVRWPLGGRQESFVVTSIEWPDRRGELVAADMGTVFYRNLPDTGAIDFAPNPRFIETVEGDYNVIDVSGAVITAQILVDQVDAKSGYFKKVKKKIRIDLRDEPDKTLYFLGTYVDDPALRRVYHVYLDREQESIVAELMVYEKQGDKFRPVKVEGETRNWPLEQPLGCTLSHEMKRDNPEMYQTLLDVALRQAQNICADTDKQAPVWNGAVTRLQVKKVAVNPRRRTEHWRVEIKVLSAGATLDYLVRRDEDGKPVEYCPAVSENSRKNWPDFLWQYFPDIASKGMENGEWVINQAMLERGIVSVHTDSSAPGGFYVYDDHIKNVFEILYAAMAGYRFSIVHDNKRYVFSSVEAWDSARTELEERRAALTFEE